MGALSFTVLLDLCGPLVRRFGKGEVNAAASVADDAQSHGIENSSENGEADEEEQDTTGQCTQHVNGAYLIFFDVRLLPLSFASNAIATPFSTMNVTVVVESLLPSA